ncbi:hypothetical protein [Nocardia miyunensis]|uniref:hypothetical protein n=1 Tax=Nocardia miyunensis TaxID=282684 RepID=UPI0008327715|nr:hypothetical protein [Nocardia miyunensis]
MDVVAVGGLVVGVGSLGVAGWALRVAIQSKQESGKANQTSEQALGVANEANTIAYRSEARETERHDVDWGWDWAGPGFLVLTNTGDDEAREVRADMTVDGETVTAREDAVPGRGGDLRFRFPLAAARRADEVRKRQEYEREITRQIENHKEAERQAKERYGVTLSARNPLQDDFQRQALATDEQMHRWSLRVVWVSPLGQPRTHEDEGFCGLSPRRG